MPVKNLNVGDIALIELDRHGRTAAPLDVLQKLDAKGYVTLSRGKPSLTPAGQKRAARLKGAEHDLRKLFTATGGPALTAPGGAAFHT